MEREILNTSEVVVASNISEKVTFKGMKFGPTK